MEGKTIRFADIIATDMEASSAQHLHHNCWIEPSLVETAEEDDEEEASIRSEESEDDRTRIYQQLLYALSGAGFVVFLVWGGKKIRDLFKKRVEEEEDDRAGGGFWGNNPIEEHLQITDTVKGKIKDAVQGMFTSTSSPGAVGGTLTR
jgi:hypothetical protein